ncbi:MAG TPA: glycosyltransferase family 39 protein [Candidatus Sumerlaeota bacterium]|nr:MAG: Undecaprenyl phosphate-alpha-4-amino-4-deoxy-L-arabinose arabinosyl transferase [candidate division BRC1 bacterium ADurb.Bin183]HOE64129.1 glycosyltransferase family 39 protein [Candidatus Sumerlaeota bacterium]HRR30791.1 glycosyltransferase family 39 protein [Candidatus Sumerlaeia bacterium]HON51300.1 glycosyltransferase family 39 protein [Candidatus Sumerlaeota bacterium]HOR65678.1 glycosyltransferase family 39 protein [Candidatus Sumerlaeota bacterium]
MRRISRIYLFFALIALFYLGLPSFIRPLYPRDEGRYAEVARQATDNGCWLIPYLNGIPHLTKPPLYYDLTGVAFSLLGQNLFSARLISVISFMGCLLLTIKWAGKQGGIEAAKITAILTFAMVQPVLAGQFGDLNMLLTFFVTAGMLLIFDGMLNPEKRYSWHWGWALVSLGFLVKGPPALILPVGTISLFRIVHGRSAKINWKPLVAAFAIFMLIAAPWFLWILASMEKNVIPFWWKYSLQRSAINKERSSVFYFFNYLPIVILGTSGWGLAYYWGLIKRIKRSMPLLINGQFSKGFMILFSGANAFESFLLSWIIFTLAFFSLIRATMFSYIQPLYPAAALFLGVFYAKKYKTWSGFYLTHHKRIIASLSMTCAIIWIFACVYYLARFAPPSKKFIDNSYELNAVGDKIEPAKGRQFDLIQIDEFSPYINYVLKKDSILVETEIHKDLPIPPAFSASWNSIEKKIQNNDPLLIVAKRKYLQEKKINNYNNINILFEGQKFTVLKTRSLQF